MFFTFVFFCLQGLLCAFLNCVNLSANALETVSIIVISTTTLVCLLELNKFLKKTHCVFIVYCSFLFRLFLLFWDVYAKKIFLLPNSGTDSEGFYASGLQYMQYGFGGPELYGGVYAKVLGVLFRIFGPQRMIAQYFNLLLSLAVILLFFRIVAILQLSPRAKMVSLAAIAFLPNYAVLSVVLMRESIITFFVAASLYFFVNWLKKGGTFFFITAFVLPLIAAMFHSGAIAPSAVYFISLMILDRKTMQLNLSTKRIFAAGLCVLFFAIVYQGFGELILGKFGKIDGFSSLEQRASYTNIGGSAYSVGIAISNPTLSLIINTPIRSIAFLLSPFPWEWRSVADIIAFLFSAVPYTAILFYALYLLKRKKASNKTLLLLLIGMAIASAFIFAWGVSNAGTALRHRDKFIAIYVLLLALEINSKQRRPFFQVIE